MPQVLLKALIRLLKARLKVLLKVLIRLLKARLKVLLKVLLNVLLKGSFFSIFGRRSPEITIFDLRFGFYAKFQPMGSILRSVDLNLTIVFWF